MDDRLDRVRQTHGALSRTSPKGGPFVGRCLACGQDGLTLRDMHKPCANPANLTQGDLLGMAISDAGGEE